MSAVWIDEDDEFGDIDGSSILLSFATIGFCVCELEDDFGSEDATWEENWESLSLTVSLDLDIRKKAKNPFLLSPLEFLDKDLALSPLEEFSRRSSLEETLRRDLRLSSTTEVVFARIRELSFFSSLEVFEGDALTLASLISGSGEPGSNTFLIDGDRILLFSSGFFSSCFSTSFGFSMAFFFDPNIPPILIEELLFFFKIFISPSSRASFSSSNIFGFIFFFRCEF